MNNTTSTILDTILDTNPENVAEHRAALMLQHAIWNYQTASQQVIEFAGYVKESMERIITIVEHAHRVYSSDITSWHGRLTEAVAERQVAADKITEMSYLLGVDDDTREAMWVEIERKV